MKYAKSVVPTAIAAGAFLGLSLALPNAAQASLVGDTITLSVDLPFEFTPSGSQTVNAVVGAGVEAKIEDGSPIFVTSPPPPAWNVNVDASSFTITAAQNGAGYGPVLTLSDLDWINGAPQIITGVNLTAVSGTGLTAASILAFGDDFVTVDLGEGGGGEPGWSATYTLETAPVPVPAAVWLFGSGLLGLIGIARRKAA